MKRGNKIILTTMILMLVLVIPFISADISEWFNRLTGKAAIDLNITVTAGDAPNITAVYNTTMTDFSSGPNAGPTSSTIEINFTAWDAQGYGNLNSSTALVNFTNGTTTRENSSCVQIPGEASGNYANYTCTIKLWWWDGSGTWDITAYIADINGNDFSNTSTSFYFGETDGFSSSPSNLTWNSIEPGASNQLSNNDPMLFNNTGNVVRNLEINSTNLRGESNSNYALWAGNFSSNTIDSCGGTSMVNDVYTQVSGASLPIGNYTLADGTAQENLYFCLEVAGSDLPAQAYSTSQEGAWDVRLLA